MRHAIATALVILAAAHPSAAAEANLLTTVGPDAAYATLKGFSSVRALPLTAPATTHFTPAAHDLLFAADPFPTTSRGPSGSEKYCGYILLRDADGRPRVPPPCAARPAPRDLPTVAAVGVRPDTRAP